MGLAQRHCGSPKKVRVFIEPIGQPGCVIKKPGLADRPGGPRRGVQPASAAGGGVPAIDVPARGLKKTGIGMKRAINYAMPVLLRVGNKMGEQTQAVGQGARTERQ